MENGRRWVKWLVSGFDRLLLPKYAPPSEGMAPMDKNYD
jgi:hypothetical protein